MNNYKIAFWVLLAFVLIMPLLSIFTAWPAVFGWHGMGMMGYSGSNYECSSDHHNDMGMAEMRQHHLSMQNDIISSNMAAGEYACCLEKPCSYCIEKTPGHGEGASCHCLDDIMNGRHPCGECIGEILEGHGNKYISEYFATSVAEEIGEEYLEEVKEIIEQKYGTPVDKQK